MTLNKTKTLTVQLTERSYNSSRELFETIVHEYGHSYLRMNGFNSLDAHYKVMNYYQNIYFELGKDITRPKHLNGIIQSLRNYYGGY